MGKKSQGKPKTGDEQPVSVDESAEAEFSTFRILAADGEDLAELAEKRKQTIAACYHELCAPLVRKLLIAETAKRLQDLKKTGEE